MNRRGTTLPIVLVALVILFVAYGVTHMVSASNELSEEECMNYKKMIFISVCVLLVCSMITGIAESFLPSTVHEGKDGTVYVVKNDSVLVIKGEEVKKISSDDYKTMK